MGYRDKSISSNPNWCVLCGLQIPDCIVWQGHPLAGSIEHLRPISLGGQNVASNRFPAHRLCNNRKGNREKFTLEDGVKLQDFVIPLLRRVDPNIKLNRKQLREAAKRIRTLDGIPDRRSLRYNHPIQRWEDDGGFVYSEPGRAEPPCL